MKIKKEKRKVKNKKSNQIIKIRRKFHFKEFIGNILSNLSDDFENVIEEENDIFVNKAYRELPKMVGMMGS